MKSQYAREAAQVQQVHPGIDDASARRVAEQYVVVAVETGTDVKTLIEDSARAAGSSAAGNDVTP